MLNVIEYGKDAYDFPALLVLGCFDAIHVGHRELIKKAKLQAKINGLDLGVMLFRDGKGGKTVYSFEERIAALEEFNVKFVLVIDYTEAFKATDPIDFLHTLEEKINVKAYMSGKDFRFGANAKGKSSTLKSYAEDEDNGVWYMPVKDVMTNDEKVSTTLIKKYLEEGNIAAANAMLGSYFSVTGEVVKGAGRGNAQLGYPTANIVYPENKAPLKYGVYAVKSVIDGTEYYGIANYGNCPTFCDERIALEVCFDLFSGDLYGKTLNIAFIGYLRDIVVFETPEQLAAQLDEDKAALQSLELALRMGADEADADQLLPKPAAAEPVKEEPAQPEVIEEVAVEEPAQPEVIEKAAAEEAAADVQAAEEVSAEEYKDLASGFDDVAVPDEEETAAEESAAVEEVNEKVEETAQTEEAEIAEEVSEEGAAQPEGEQELPSVEQTTEDVTEEIIREEEEITEEPAEQEAEELPAEEAVQQSEETVEEEYEIIDGGFDDIVEVPDEETAEYSAEDSAAEITEETVGEEKEDNEDKID